MSLAKHLKAWAAWAGYHIVRNHNNPEHTLAGLGGLDFRTIIDIGANTGQFARDIRARFPTARIYCFEPVPQAFAMLEAWAAADGRAEAVQLALGDEPGRVEMFVHTNATTSSSLLPTTSRSHELYPTTVKQTTVSVAVQRLDDWARLSGADLARALVKIDVQGYEANVLRGGPNVLAKAKAVIIEVNIEGLYEGQGRFRDLVQLLDAAGLKYAGNLSQACAADGRIVFVDAVFVRPDNEAPQ